MLAAAHFGCAVFQPIRQRHEAFVGPSFTPPERHTHFRFNEDIGGVEAAYGRRLGDGEDWAAFVEVPFIASHVNVESSQIAAPDSRAVHVFAPGFRVHVPLMPLVPRSNVWFGAGGGVARWSESARLVSGAPNRHRQSATRGAFQFGVGFEVRISDAITWRVGARGIGPVPALSFPCGPEEACGPFTTVAANGVVVRFN
jgi:hypothetical protein